jgi:hypothetical protein
MGSLRYHVVQNLIDTKCFFVNIIVHHITKKQNPGWKIERQREYWS